MRDDFSGKRGGDAQRAGEAAATEIGLKHTDAGQKRLQLAQTAVALAERERGADGGGEGGVGVDLFGIERALEPAGVARIKVAAHRDGAIGWKMPETIDREPHSDRQPIRDGEQVEPLALVVEFYNRDALVGIACGKGGAFRRALAGCAAEVDGNAELRLGAQQRADGLVGDFAGEIPQGEVHAAHRIEHEASVVAAYAHGGIHAVPQRCDPLRGAVELLALERRTQQVGDDAARDLRRERGLRLAPAHKAVGQLDAHQSGLEVLRIENRVGGRPAVGAFAAERGRRTRGAARTRDVAGQSDGNSLDGLDAHGAKQRWAGGRSGG